ncbi:MAG: LrgB family protein [Clostridia bacterium]|nr:LrgB family protein [Clostridia bacterium]
MANWLTSSLFYGAVLTIIAYEIGLLLRRRFKAALVNPILIGVILVIAINQLTKTDYETYHQSAQYLSWLLTPATICLAVPLYEQMTLLKKNLLAVACALIAGVLSSLGGVLVFSLAWGLDHQMYVTLLPKSITTAIGMAVAQELGGIVPLAVAVIIFSGLMGHMLASAFFKLIGVKEPAAKGLAIGTASHAIGTSRALEMGPVEGAMSSLAIAAAGILTVTCVSFFAGLH